LRPYSRNSVGWVTQPQLGQEASLAIRGGTVNPDLANPATALDGLPQSLGFAASRTGAVVPAVLLESTGRAGGMNMTDAGTTRERSFGEGYRTTLVDRFGVWLSSRQIQRYVPEFRGKRLGDFGCGFHAAFSRTVLDEVGSAVLVDVSLSPELRAHPRVTALQGVLPDVLSQLPAASLDIVLCVSVLEHLWEPLRAISEFRCILAPGGVCLLNVPSWRGKRFLEYSAFRLGLSPAEEMDDHKSYYDVKDLWPLLVRGGFKPSRIECFSHKFGLNTFAVGRAED
jgi:SAM-dependent methyltransferase